MRLTFESHERLSSELARRLGLPPEAAGWASLIVDAAEGAFTWLDAKTARRWLEAFAIRVAWYHRDCPRDDRQADALAGQSDSYWYWHTSALIACREARHRKRRCPCRPCLKHTMVFFRNELRDDGSPPIRSEWIRQVLWDVVVPTQACEQD